jgi:glutathione S-transferase
METPLRLHGALGSPYSLKVRSLLRYRRIPFLWVQDVAARQILFARVKAPVIPLLEYADGAVENDSTPMIASLEERHPERSVVPPDPASAFLSALIEDFADEWLVKAMFQFRWRDEPDQRLLGAWLAFDSLRGAGTAALDALAETLRQRQVGRMPMVGCTPENDPLIVASTRALLAILEAHLADGWFLFGTRPSAAEFALYGQLSQLASDPAPSAMMRADFPRAQRWVAHLDDLSGHDGEWGPPGPMVEPLLALIGAVYLPFLVANAAAIDLAAAEVRFEAMGHPFAQAPYRYQAKCLAELRAAHAALPAETRDRLAPLLDRTGCLDPLAGSNLISSGWNRA